jgi:MFS family permease
LPQALSHRNFRIFLVTQGVAFVGMQMLALAEVWLVLVLTSDPLVVGLVAAAQGISVALVSLVGGVIADRFPKRRIILAAQSSIMLSGLVLATLTVTQVIEVWQIVLLVLALGCGYAIAMPARQAFVVDMVGPADVASAVGLFTALYHASAFVGPSLGGLAIAAFTQGTGHAIVGTGLAMAAGAVAFGSAVVGLLLLRDEELIRIDQVGGPAARQPVFQEILGGFRYLWSARPVLMTLLVPGSIAVIASNFPVLVPVYGREAGMGAGEVGVLMSVYAVGGLIAALRIGLGGAAGPRVLVVGAAILGIASLGIGIIGRWWIWPALLFAAGFGASTMRTTSNAEIQLASPGQVRGRVMSIYFLVFEGISPLGAVVAGAIAGLAGAQAAFVVGGAGALTLLALGLDSILRLRKPPIRLEPEAITAP